MKVKIQHWIYLAIFIIASLWSGYNAYDLTLWFLEAGMCLVGVAVLIFTYTRFRFTELTYAFILIHIIVLLIGAHYSYAKVPAFDWLAEAFGWTRNNYDKLGHFMQGFVPAMIIREVLMRRQVLQKKSWLPFIVVSICLAISAFYELIEWWVAVSMKDVGNDFLGTQGYEWDTQSDMFLAMIGATTMLILFSKLQNMQIKQLTAEDTE